MQPGRSNDYGLYRQVGRTHIGGLSINIDRRAPDVLDHARVDEPTRTKSCSASPTSGADRRHRRTRHPAQHPSIGHPGHGRRPRVTGTEGSLGLRPHRDGNSGRHAAARARSADAVEQIHPQYPSHVEAVALPLLPIVKING
jgi:hypothetical protein